MRTAIYIEDNRQQLVLTPEDDFEKNILKMLHKNFGDKTFMGQFYKCQGGWIRHRDYGDQDESLIILLEKEPTDETRTT